MYLTLRRFGIVVKLIVGVVIELAALETLKKFKSSLKYPVYVYFCNSGQKLPLSGVPEINLGSVVSTGDCVGVGAGAVVGAGAGAGTGAVVGAGADILRILSDRENILPNPLVLCIMLFVCYYCTIAQFDGCDRTIQHKSCSELITTQISDNTVACNKR